ncbi:alpha/beta hydrolase [Portibacter lacus]|uniref:Alpha/beta hydrolase n=1 Tax=Portibacter lacus TaxID=1099794 RepID=A0AA37SKG4_9BACT|nr:alpha/beta hydrolase [Portibacter lacus]GLR16268.1 hypothetical protein GCM10007940_08830 [Portibacter lacus]
MVRLVFIPSFGTDSTLYDNLKSSGGIDHPALFTEWLPVQDCQTFEDYASHFIDHYHITSNDILIGVSLGGVLSIEINKVQPVKKIIAISTIKTKLEKPMLFRVLQKSGTYKLFSPNLMKFGLDILMPFYGKNISSYHWFRRVFKSSDNEFLKWSFNRIVCWENESLPDNIVHVHGTRDPLFPLKNGANIDYKIKNGTHAMIRFNSEEIASIIKQELK